MYTTPKFPKLTERGTPEKHSLDGIYFYQVGDFRLKYTLNKKMYNHINPIQRSDLPPPALDTIHILTVQFVLQYKEKEGDFKAGADRTQTGWLH